MERDGCTRYGSSSSVLRSGSSVGRQCGEVSHGPRHTVRRCRRPGVGRLITGTIVTQQTADIGRLITNGSNTNTSRPKSHWWRAAERAVSAVRRTAAPGRAALIVWSTVQPHSAEPFGGTGVISDCILYVCIIVYRNQAYLSSK